MDPRRFPFYLRDAVLQNEFDKMLDPMYQHLYWTPMDKRFYELIKNA
jgi:hypothetical protein